MLLLFSQGTHLQQIRGYRLTWVLTQALPAHPERMQALSKAVCLAACWLGFDSADKLARHFRQRPLLQVLEGNRRAEKNGAAQIILQGFLIGTFL